MGRGGHDGCDCHDHNCEAENCAADFVLYEHVDVANVRALNEALPGCAGERLLRAWPRRLDFSAGPCDSADDDPELIVHVPFNVDVKIKSLCIIGGPEGSSPGRVRAFLNRDDIDFSNVEDIPAVQEWDLIEDRDGVLEYQTKYQKFQGVSNITLHFPEALGANFMRLFFLGFKGEATKNRREPVGAFVYESAPVPDDHKTEANQHMNFGPVC